MKIVFLDIDGVLNTYANLMAHTTITLIEPHLARRLNEILLWAEAKIVVSSTWRHLILNGHYDYHGFAHMLKTHGILSANVVGTTGTEPLNRGRQIRAWLRENVGVTSYVILDDDDEGMDFHGERYIRVDSRYGLQDAHVDRVFRLFGVDPPQRIPQETMDEV